MRFGVRDVADLKTFTWNFQFSPHEIQKRKVASPLLVVVALFQFSPHEIHVNVVPMMKKLRENFQFSPHEIPLP